MSSSDLNVVNTKSSIKMKLKQYNSMQQEYNQMLQKAVTSQSKVGSPVWKNVNSSANVLTISTVGTWFWGLSNSLDVFSCKAPCDETLSTTTKTAYSISTDGISVYAAGTDNTLAKRSADPSDPVDWATIPTPVPFVSIVATEDSASCPYSSKLWALGPNTSRELYVCDKPCNDASGWKKVNISSINDQLMSISVDNDDIWAISFGGKAYKQKLSTSIVDADKWELVSDSAKVNGETLKIISAVNKKNVVAVSKEGNVYQCEKPCDDGKWKKIESLPADKPVGVVTGLSTNDEIYASIPGEPGIWSYDTNSVFPEEFSWTDNLNTNAGGNNISTAEGWMLLGNVDTIEKCKEKASTSDDTYSSIVYFTPQYTGDEGKSKSCYGMVYDESSPTIETTADMQNVITSTPPDGVSKIGGKKAYQLLQNMQQVQNDLAKLIDNVEDEKVTMKMMGPSSTNMTALTETLNRNRGLINDTLSKSNVFAKEEIASLKENTSYLSYLSWLILSILCIILCIQLVRNDASSVPSIVYILIAVLILYNIRAYFFAFSDTSSNLLSSVGKTLSSV